MGTMLYSRPKRPEIARDDAAGDSTRWLLEDYRLAIRKLNE